MYRYIYIDIYLDIDIHRYMCVCDAVYKHGTQSDKQDPVWYLLAGAVSNQTQHEGQSAIISATRWVGGGPVHSLQLTLFIYL